ncbi:hypothetical protein NF27_DT01040 [Candidatus Jidaibacter acanthamoeba]|uniref:DNA replication and repair protein RecF n=1 Tax=Candidatus Jidaibacter acanthamoebae TaxID=86105 RepID=A0A0C1QZ98_9RICK|nr:DNA replication/repair protein RecF [Candidatus Jidaibacter acanthamoeba]KIE05330.1 hypothetical protein NF27_DT01040 [Candidatus Jidaibacter acanthamoeba]
MTISKLTLTGFRNHISLNLSLNSNFVVICGQNGVGKTNVLEAISFLAPGKGFRNAGSEDIFNKNDNRLNEWAVSAELECGYDDIRITTGCKLDTYQNISRRIIKVNDELSYKSSELLNYLKVIWITPQTDRIFLESPGVRRKFLDRVTYNFFPLHASHIVNYEKLVRSRLKIIQQSKFDEIWVAALEKQLATLNFQIYQNRTNCLNMIKESLNLNSSNFLKPSIGLIGSIDNFLIDIKNNEVEQIQEKLKSNRRTDALSGRTNFGIHKSDIEAFHPIKHIKADQCSTGEQKAMLISIILAQIKSIKQISSTPVILLLDEVFSHLDINFRQNLIEELFALEVQAWITTANEHIIEEINYKKNVVLI